MNDDERRHFNNLILLCEECHTIVDNFENELVYTVELLRKWKSDHEATARAKVLTARPTLLGMVIDAIARADLDEDPGLPPEGTQAFGIEDKIEYNCVRRNRALIDEFKVYYPKVSSVYEALEGGGSFKKDRLLRNVRRIYLEVKGKYVEDSADPMQVVRERADDIMDDVQDRLLSVVETSNSSSVEDVDVGIALVMVDAFMRCKKSSRRRRHDRQPGHQAGEANLPPRRTAPGRHRGHSWQHGRAYPTYESLNARQGVSVNAFLLALDWLFLIGAVSSDNGRIKKCF